MSKVAILSPSKPASRIGRILRRTLLGLLGLLIALVLFLVLSVWLDSVFGRSATDFTNITYNAPDGTELHAYLTQPEDGGDNLPAVMMFHEWWGINRDITELADALAAEGYVVLAPDVYRNQTTRWIPRAIWLVTQTDQDQVGADVDAGFEYLANMNNVDAERIGSTGFCFGGRQSLELAKRQRDALTAMVSLYGTAYTDTDPINELPTNMPLLGIYGEDDQSIAADDVRKMDKLMAEAGLNHEITIYPGVGHAFINSENYAEADAASGQAWDQMVAFLGEHLQAKAEAQMPTVRSQALAKSTSNSHFICLIPQ